VTYAVDDIAIGIFDEKALHAPRFFGQGIDDIEAQSQSFGMKVVRILDLDGNTG
jgi:hypothetical protein